MNNQRPSVHARKVPRTDKRAASHNKIKASSGENLHRASSMKKHSEGTSSRISSRGTNASYKHAHAADAATVDVTAGAAIGAAGHASGASADAPSWKDKLLTRRNFLIGGGVLAAGAAAGAGISLYKKNAQNAELEAVRQVAGDAAGAAGSSGATALLSVPESAVFTTENCEYIEDTENVLGLYAKASLPHGTLLWASDDNVAACLLPTDSSAPLTQIGLLSLSSGNLSTPIKEPVGGAKNFQIFDVRANGTGMIWVEADIWHNVWRIYTASVSDLMAGTPVLAAEGGAAWEMPTLAICKGYGFWQMVPSASAAKSMKSADIKSSLMRVPIGGGVETAEQIYQAKGYMACAPTNSPTGIAFAPRSAESGTYYQLTHVDAETGEVTDQLTLPASMKPTEIAYGDTGFSFSFSGIYSYGGGIANLGTYTPAAPVSLTTQQAIQVAREGIEDEQPVDKEGARKPLDASQEETATARGEEAVTDLYSAAEWFRFPRTPLTSPAWCGGWFIVKSTNVVAGIDLTGKRYFTLSADGEGESYGEFLASSGTVGKIVTYANLDYTPINGEPVKECAVRIWSV